MLQRLTSHLSTVLPDLYAPQPTTADGPYSRFSCKEGSFVIILSMVKNAEKRPYLVHASFSPRRSASAEVKKLRFFVDAYPAHMQMTRRTQGDEGRVAAWSLEAKGEKETARYDVDAGKQVFSLSFPALQRRLKLDITCTEQMPYSLLGPLGLSRLFSALLPSKWHVFSTRSEADIQLSDADTGNVLLKTSGAAHLEKNFGNEFPTQWMRVSLYFVVFELNMRRWGQAMAHTSRGSLVFAGGNVAPGLRSLFCAVRSPTGRAYNFGPASTVQIAGYGPGMQLEQDSRRGFVSLVLTDWLKGRRATIRGQADPSTFLEMAAPMPEGHRQGYCYESFDARYRVELEERRWLRFEKVEEFEMEDGAPLEFGGDWSHFGKK